VPARVTLAVHERRTFRRLTNDPHPSALAFRTHDRARALDQRFAFAPRFITLAEQIFAGIASAIVHGERTDTPRTNAGALRTRDVADHRMRSLQSKHVPLVIAEIASCSSATPVCASHFETPPDRIVRVVDGIATIKDSRLCRYPRSDHGSRNGSDRSSCTLKTT
jgi:hypothetical protein